ncbi:MAG: mercury(II) reductase [Spirochaetales bacterium]|nr:mercury(II) reductase [Spirochaetales bacterium]
MEKKLQIEIAELDIRGMTCEDCAHHVTKALLKVEGVYEAVVPGWKSQRAEVRLSTDTPSAALAEAVKAAGYGAQVKIRHGVSDAKSPQEEGSAPEKKDYDLIVIGTGGAGVAAAIRAAESGYRVAIVELGTVGGTCVNIGCVPSKTLIRAAEAYHHAAHPHFEGVQTHADSVDWETVVRQKDQLVEGLRQEKYLDVLASYGENITLIRGKAHILADGTVSVDNGNALRAGKILIATGASPRILELRGIEDVPVLTSTSLLALKKLPKSLIVIGGRAIALELGQTLQRFGVQVTILQRGSRLLPDHEPEVSEAIERYLGVDGIEVHTGVHPAEIRQEGGETIITATVGKDKREYRAEQVLMAVGRVPNTENLGLEEAGVDVDQDGFIIVDESMRTTNPKIYAAGDVTTLPKLVYVAAAGGSIAATNALNGTRTPFDLSVVPDVVFTDPQVATVGLTERAAREAGYNVKTSVLPLDYVPRALAARDTRGLIKLVADATTDKLLGCQLVAPEGGEIIQTATLAIKFGISIGDLVGTLFPYLTLGEGIKLAAQTFDKDLTKLSCCAG